MSAFGFVAPIWLCVAFSIPLKSQLRLYSQLVCEKNQSPYLLDHGFVIGGAAMSIQGAMAQVHSNFVTQSLPRFKL